MGSTPNSNTSLLDASKSPASDKTTAPLAGNSSRVSFEFKNVQPPSILYIDYDDALAISAATSQVSEILTVNVRLLEPDGRLQDMQFKIAPVNTRAVARLVFPLTQGYILSISAAAAVATTRGMTFLRVGIQRGASGPVQPSQMLFADYVTTLATSAYPYGRVLAPTEGPGWINSLIVANPAAGAEWTQAVPVNTRWRIRSAGWQLNASATVATRVPGIKLSSTQGLMWVSDPNMTVVAGGVANIFAAGIVPFTGGNPAIITVALPPDLVMTGLPANVDTIGSSTLALQAGDQYSAIVLFVEEWLDNV